MKEKKIHLTMAVLATGIMSFAGVLIETAMNVTFPTLIKQFGISTGTVQWVTTIYLLVIAIMVPLANFLLKNMTLRRLFFIANVIFILGIVTDFLAFNFPILLLGRILQGISTGIALPLMFHIILKYSPLKMRGTMMGLGTLTTSIAPAIGPTYGGILTSALSWHYIFIFLVPVLLLSLVLGLIAIPDLPIEKSGKMDLVSLLGLALLFSGSLIFLNQIGSWLSIIPLAVGILGLVIFYRQATHTKEPLVSLKILKNSAFRTFLLAFLVCQFLLLGVSFVLPNFVQIVLGKDAFVAGLVMFPGATVGALLAPISGRMLDQFGPKKPILIGLALAAIGWMWLTIILRAPILLGLVAGHVFYMIGIGFAYSNLMTSGMSQIDDADFGDGNTIFNTLQQFAGAVATAIVATIINFVQNNQADLIRGTILGSQLALAFLLVLLLLVFVAVWREFQRQKK